MIDSVGRPRHYSKASLQYLEDREVTAFFRVIRKSGSTRDLAIFECAYHRGLRASEVGLLQLADLDLPKRTLHVHRKKKGTAGYYVLTDREMSALESWLRDRGHAEGPLFISRRGTKISRQRLDELQRLYGAAAGLPRSKWHFHTWRHTAGTILSEKADLLDVQDHLGHRDIRSTMVYAKVRNKRRLELGKRLANDW